jgi:hypothetical protein
MKRIVLFTDSLAMPREEPEITYYEDTYPYLLRNDYEVFQFSKGGGVMSEFVEQTFYYNQYKPDIIILQLGIVDCGPRAFTKLEEAIFHSNRVFGLIRSVLSRTKLSKKIRNIRRVSWTSEKKYEQGCRFFIDKFKNSKVYALSIVPTTEEYEKQVPGISKKVKRYNDILKNVFQENLIDISGIPTEGIMSDHHHLTKVGHQYVYGQILRKLDD